MTELALVSHIKRGRSYQKPHECHAPAYTLRSRTSFGAIRNFTTSKDARPEVTSKDVIGALNCTLPRPPAFSLVSRSYVDETRECTKSPGPQHYSVPGIISNVDHPLYPMPPTKGFAGSERQMHVANKTPAPGEYELKADTYMKKAPAYGFRLKPNEICLSSLAPDSGSYDVADITRHGRVWRGPAWSVQGRTEYTEVATDDDAIHIPSADESLSILKRRKLDTSGGHKSRPVPNWSFAKCRRFL